MSKTLRHIFQELNLIHLYEPFEVERIEVDNFLCLSDEEMERLGVSALGDRIRLRESVRFELGDKKTDKKRTEPKESTTTSSALFLERNRSILFGNSKGKRRARRSLQDTAPDPKKSRSTTAGPKSWTANFFCLADKEAKTVPSAAQREMLYKAGLGAKKIKLLTSDGEAEVLSKLTSDTQTEEGVHTIGFPQLSTCGGFELLKCNQNCRELSIIDCEWSVPHLRSYLGNQTKIYIRPVQNNLSTEPIFKQQQCQSEEYCNICQKKVSIRDLRSHIKRCGKENNSISLKSDTSDSDELPDLARVRPNDNPDNIVKIDVDVTKKEKDHICSSIVSAHFSSGQQKEESVESGIQQTVESDIQADVWVKEIETTLNAATCTCSFATSDIDNTQDSPGAIVITHDQESFIDDNVKDSGINSVISKAINYCFTHDINDPTEILRYMQSVIVTGRKLEAIDDAVLFLHSEGATNFILVDRKNVLETGFDEIRNIPNEDLRKTLEVQFYSEVYLKLFYFHKFILLCKIFC